MAKKSKFAKVVVALGAIGVASKIAYDKYKNFANFGRKIAEWALENRTKKYESFLFETAEERYLRFIAENKPILNRISLSHLASYLGIERQSLSRIRSKILSQM